MESAIGLYKTELIKPRGPWKSLAQVELATAEYVEWFNSAWLHSAIGHVPPAEYEAAYYAHPAPTGGWSQHLKPPPNPGRFTNHGHARRNGDRGQPLTLAAVGRAAGCYCAAAIHATGKRESLEDLTDDDAVRGR
jgi:Integrase core domain